MNEFKDYTPDEVQKWFNELPENEDFAEYAHLFTGLKGSRVLGLSEEQMVKNGIPGMVAAALWNALHPPDDDVEMGDANVDENFVKSIKEKLSEAIELDEFQKSLLSLSIERYQNLEPAEYYGTAPDILLSKIEKTILSKPDSNRQNRVHYSIIQSSMYGKTRLIQEMSTKEPIILIVCSNNFGPTNYYEILLEIKEKR